MRRLFLALAAAIVVADAAPARAGGPLVVVELFTSQGCSSCPPADELLGDLAGREDVLPLSMHVDYWDYLGWRDTLAIPGTGARQRAYRDAWGSRFVYTPQMVVDGHVEVRGPKPRLLDRAIGEARGVAPRVEIVLEPGDDGLRAVIGPAPAGAEIWQARYSPAETVEIVRGENAGREITYHNVVRRLERVGRTGAAGETALSLEAPAPGEGLALWVQEAGAGRILGSARLRP